MLDNEEEVGEEQEGEEQEEDEEEEEEQEEEEQEEAFGSICASIWNKPTFSFSFPVATTIEF